MRTQHRKLIAVLVFGLGLLPAAETKVNLTDLPEAVRVSVQEQLRGRELVGVTREVEKGKTLYELETKSGGKTRDMTFDAGGAVTEVEEQVDMAAVPAAARDAIQKKAGSAKVVKVEAVSKNGVIVAYEAAVSRGRRTSEVAVTPEGKPFRD